MMTAHGLCLNPGFQGSLRVYGGLMVAWVLVLGLGGFQKHLNNLAAGLTNHLYAGPLSCWSAFLINGMGITAAWAGLGIAFGCGELTAYYHYPITGFKSQSADGLTLLTAPPGAGAPWLLYAVPIFALFLVDRIVRAVWAGKGDAAWCYYPVPTDDKYKVRGFHACR
jgi:hypothetical protein